MSKRIIRPKATWSKLACGHTKGEQDYVLRSEGDPFVPGTKIKRLRRISLGVRNIGFLESDVDALIDALAAARGA
jgi:hypothetical protein